MPKNVAPPRMRLGSSSDEEGDFDSGPSRKKPSRQQESSSSNLNPSSRPSQSQSQSPPPDPQISSFLASQRLNNNSETEAEKAARLARYSGSSSAPKSRYQREKEEAEKKKREEEKEAAHAYAAFLQDMEKPREDGRGTGKRGGGYKDKGKARAMGFVSAGGEKAYEPSRPQPPASSTSARLALTKISSAFGDDEEEDEPIPAPRKEPPGKRKRAMDEFLGQIQRDQAEREEKYKTQVGDGVSVSSLLAFSGQKIGSRDVGDPLTCNLSILNLPGDISEQALGTFFSQWGDIATVKIMWPRDDSNAFTGGAGAGMTQFRITRSAGLMGFVSYMNREDAEYAFKETDGIVWGGALLKIGWGKAMPKPSRPLFYKPKAAASSAPRSTRLRKSQSPSRNARQQRQSQLYVSPRQQLFSLIEKSSKENESLASEEKLIRTVAEKVKQYGQRFEDLIREKEKDNEKFKFLKEEDSLMSQLFLSLINESFVPEVPPLDFVDEGYASIYSTDDSEIEEVETLRKTRKAESIGPVARRRIEAMLRSITPRRERIAKCMAFCLEHASAADTISELLCQSVMIPTTPIPRKLSRLHVISDVLHNSASQIPNAWKYRLSFENRLIPIFTHLGDISRSFPGRMKMEAFRIQIIGLLEVWESWMVFPGGTLEECKKAFEEARNWNGGKGLEVKEQHLGGDGEDGDDLDGEALDLDGEELDGEVMEDDLDGEPMGMS